MNRYNWLIKCTAIVIVFIIVSMLVAPVAAYASTTAKTVSLKTVTDIEKKIDEAKYPGYKDKLLALKKANPTWNFVLYYTNLDWNTALYNETEGYHSKSLVQGKTGDWLCSKCGTTVYDAGGWMCASKQAVAYLMDVRNHLTPSYVFQFEQLSYEPETYTVSGVEKVLNGTFMYQKNIREYYHNNTYEDITFSKAIMNAASASGVSPYYLAARIRQELGVNGSGSSSGAYKGYEGYYNFYNINAKSGVDPIANGLKYASSNPGKYLLPWNDPVKAIKGGAIWIATNYIAVGQDTLYFQKFDVVQNGTANYNHQYMQNIFAARSEGYTTYNAYSKMGLLSNNYNFVIPLYENMPKMLSKEPTGTATTKAVTTTPKPKTVRPTSIKLSGSKKTLGVKETYTVKTTVYPKNATNKKVTYVSSNKKVATVNDKGKITAKKKGTAYITAKTANGKTAKIKITVKKAPTKIRLNAKTKTLRKNKTYQLKAKLSVGSAGKITYTSSNKKIATVSSGGKIKAKKKGTAYITARTYNGKKAKIKIRVK